MFGNFKILTMVKISILIPTIEGRELQYNSLINSLKQQYDGEDVEICTVKDNKEMSIGEKRNRLLASAKGDYLCFIDDDDDISANYVQFLLLAIKSGCDCVSLKGQITIDGGKPEVFEHSIKYKEWKTTENEIKYERFPNHLNCIKSNIAKQFKFPEKNFSEDFDWSTALHNSGLLKTEYYIPEIIYYYNYVSNK